jgi:hypothetical protein
MWHVTSNAAATAPLGWYLPATIKLLLAPGQQLDVDTQVAVSA